MKIGILGGGASGITAAIAAAEKGADVTILEKNERIGKKILATGNGKCNLSNLDFSNEYYRSENPEMIPDIMKQFTVDDTLHFFHRIGLMVKEKNGYLYPECEQASAVLDVLRFALERLAVKIDTGCRVIKIEPLKKGFLVHTEKEDRHFAYEFDKIILACGSRAGLKNPAEENGMKLASGFGLTRVPFSPALVQLRCKEGFFKALAGVRTQAEISLHTETAVYRESGELQLTDYGISGIPVFQLSRYAAKELERKKAKKELDVTIDFLPGISHKALEETLLVRRKIFAKATAEQYFTGTIHKKIIGVVLKECGISTSERVEKLSEEKLRYVGNKIKHFPVTVVATNPFQQAQVCSGGVRLTELTKNMEAKKQKGLYVVGELLDADGRCGGYNLQWAWTTGMIAGRAATELK